MSGAFLHTPSPWVANQRREFYNGLPQPFQIWKIDLDEPENSRFIARLSDAWDDEQRANARLMAAAPELLEALQAAQVLIAADIIRDDAGCLAKINAAIAKATGQEYTPPKITGNTAKSA